MSFLSDRQGLARNLHRLLITNKLSESITDLFVFMFAGHTQNLGYPRPARKIGQNGWNSRTMSPNIPIEVV